MKVLQWLGFGLYKQVEILMITVDQIIEKVEQQGTTLDSLNAFVEGLHQQIKDLQLNAPDQAKIDALFAAVNSHDKKLDDAFTANTPPAAGGTPINDV